MNCAPTVQRRLLRSGQIKGMWVDTGQDHVAQLRWNGTHMARIREQIDRLSASTRRADYRTRRPGRDRALMMSAATSSMAREVTALTSEPTGQKGSSIT